MDIVNKWIYQIADYSVKNNPQSPSREVIVFVFQVLANIIVSFMVTLIVCSFTGHFKQALIVIASTIIIKMFIGSLHFKSVVLCMIYSSVVMISLSHIEISSFTLKCALSLIALISVYLYAPKNVVVFFKFSQEKIKHLKWIAIVLILLSVFFPTPLVNATFIYHAISITPLFDKLFKLVERRTNI